LWPFVTAKKACVDAVELESSSKEFEQGPVTDAARAANYIVMPNFPGERTGGIVVNRHFAKEFAMKLAFRSGASIAAAAATLIVAGAALAPVSHAEEVKGHCIGANACKGQGACKSASNDCKGMNACKGKGFLTLTSDECGKIPGATFEPEKKG